MKPVNFFIQILLLFMGLVFSTQAMEGTKKRQIKLESTENKGEAQAELDMIRHAQNLTDAQQEEVIKMYREAAAADAVFSEKLGKAKGALFQAMMASHDDDSKIAGLKQSMADLNNKRLEAMLTSMKKISMIFRGSSIDRAYVYRAFLREHRRAIPGFKR